MKSKPVIERRTVAIGKRTKRGPLRMPVLETMFEDEGDPLEDVPYDDDNLEASADAEMSEMLKQIRERRKVQGDRFRVARDPDYFLVLCFQSREQRNEFLTKSGWGAEDDKYLNGLDVCRRLGLGVAPIEIKPIPLRGKPNKYSEREVLP